VFHSVELAFESIWKAFDVKRLHAVAADHDLFYRPAPLEDGKVPGRVGKRHDFLYHLKCRFDLDVYEFLVMRWPACKQDARFLLEAGEAEVLRYERRQRVEHDVELHQRMPYHRIHCK